MPTVCTTATYTSTDLACNSLGHLAGHFVSKQVPAVALHREFAYVWRDILGDETAQVIRDEFVIAHRSLDVACPIACMTITGDLPAASHVVTLRWRKSCWSSSGGSFALLAALRKAECNDPMRAPATYCRRVVSWWNTQGVGVLSY